MYKKKIAMIVFNNFLKWKDFFFCQIAENKKKKKFYNMLSMSCYTKLPQW
jgi:hypothetical protein